MSKKNDPFEKIPEFLAAFNKIRDEGFFTNFEFNGMAWDEPNCTWHIFFRISGRVPNDAKFAHPGLTAIVNVEEVVQNVRKLVSRNEFAAPVIVLETKTETWNLWDKSGNKVIGSKGQEVNLILNISLPPAKKSRKN